MTRNARFPPVAIKPNAKPIISAMPSPTTALSSVLSSPFKNVARYRHTVAHAFPLKIVSTFITSFSDYLGLPPKPARWILFGKPA